MVSCVLSATLKVYEPWLAVAKNEGQTTSEAIERCHKVWLDSTLKDAVRLSLVSSVHTLPMTAASWVEIQKLPRAAKTAIIQAAGRSTSDRSSARFCGLSLLPLLPFTGMCITSSTLHVDVFCRGVWKLRDRIVSKCQCSAML